MARTSESADQGIRIEVKGMGTRYVRVARGTYRVYVPRDIALEVADLLVDAVERVRS